MYALTKTDNKPGSLALLKCPVPRPGPGQVLLRVQAVSVCGSDLHIRDGSYPSSPPVVLGHELSGTVEELGAGVTNLTVGERVVPETYFTVCGTCLYCTTGHQNRCLSRRSIGSGEDGGMAEFVVVPAHRAHRLPDHLSFEEGAVIEPYICCVQAVYGTVQLHPGDPVLVSGPGAMGLLCTQLLREMGCQVLLVGTKKDDAWLALGRQFGASRTLYAEEPDLIEQLHALSGDLGVCAAFECSGASASVTSCLRGLRKGGTMVQVALPEKPVSIDLSLLTQEEKNITGSFATLPVWWEQGIRLLETSDRLTLKPLISEVFPLTEWECAFALTEARAGLKYVLRPQEQKKEYL